jgi:hypothetical protein
MLLRFATPLSIRVSAPVEARVVVLDARPDVHPKHRLEVLREEVRDVKAGHLHNVTQSFCVKFSVACIGTQVLLWYVMQHIGVGNFAHELGL